MKLYIYRVIRMDDIPPALIFVQPWSMVVAAQSTEDARDMHPQGLHAAKINWEEPYPEWAQAPDEVEVELIGEAAEGIEAGVILLSCVTK
jgi:hypothetical protein